MRLTNRVNRLAERLAGAMRAGGHLREAMIADLEERIAFLEHIPPDLQQAVDRRFTSSTDEAFASWRLWPFASWAPPMAPGFVFPHEFVSWLLNPPHAFWIGHTCERCGMSVPLFTAGRPDSPKDLAAFPTCPLCGGETSSAAHYQAGPKTDAGGAR